MKALNMTENKIGYQNKDKNNEIEGEKEMRNGKEEREKDKNLKQQQQINSQKEQQHKTEQHDSRFRRLSQFLDLLNIPRYHSGGHSGSSSSSNNSQQHSPQTPHAAGEMLPTVRRCSNSNTNNHSTSNITAGCDAGVIFEQEQQQQQHGCAKRLSCTSFRSEILLLDLVNGEISDFTERTLICNDDGATQRVYKKTSPNYLLTMYLPTREIILSGNSSSTLSGVVYVDAKELQGQRVYAQLTLTFRYGREDEEVMGLRFCNEAIMSLYQIWPRNKELNKPALTLLQEALLKRLGDGAYPFTLTLTAQAPPSVQLVPAKRYYGAPIGTSYDVRCFIAHKTDEKLQRRASVKMGVRVIYHTDVFSQANSNTSNPENSADLMHNSVTTPAVALTSTNTLAATATPISAQTTESKENQQQSATTNAEPTPSSTNETEQSVNKPRKSERGDSFPKLRLSPKTFRFSGRFGRSKSEVDKCPSDAFYNYSKSFQESESVAAPVVCSGPQGAVDKPFLLQDGRVGLRASLNKAWYTHGEDVCVTINIRNDSKKTVRKIRVCAIQHVDVCMFNNGKFKNVVADSDSVTPPAIDQHVAPGATLNTIVILKPQRGPTKNWIALEDTLQRCTEPDEINAFIAASAVRTPHFLMQLNQSPNNCSSPPAFVPSPALANPTNDERNVFAIYVSYYVKVKLTLSGMGGELSLKLPFMLVHIDETQSQLHKICKLSLKHAPAHKKTDNKAKSPLNVITNLDRIESVEEGNLSNKASPLHLKANYKHQLQLKENHQDSILQGNERRHIFKRSETLARDLEAEDVENSENNQQTKNEQQLQVVAQIHSTKLEQQNSSSCCDAANELDISTNCKRMLEKNSQNLMASEMQQISEKLVNKNLMDATGNALNSGSPNVV